MNSFTQKLKEQLQDLSSQPQEDVAETTSSFAAAEVDGLLIAQGTQLVTARRLIVLVPNADFDDAQVAREIWNLAFPPRLAVLFLGLCPNADEEPRLRRRLVTLAALTRDPRINVDMKIEFGRNWIARIKALLQTGDIVVCHAEQRIGLWQKSLELELRRLHFPTLTLKGYVPTMSRSPSSFLRETAFWFVSICILIGFFWLQVQAVQISEAWAKNTLLGLSIPVELGLLWLWHSLSM